MCTFTKTFCSVFVLGFITHDQGGNEAALKIKALENGQLPVFTASTARTAQAGDNQSTARSKNLKNDSKGTDPVNQVRKALPEQNFLQELLRKLPLSSHNTTYNRVLRAKLVSLHLPDDKLEELVKGGEVNFKDHKELGTLCKYIFGNSVSLNVLKHLHEIVQDHESDDAVYALAPTSNVEELLLDVVKKREKRLQALRTSLKSTLAGACSEFSKKNEQNILRFISKGLLSTCSTLTTCIEGHDMEALGRNGLTQLELRTSKVGSGCLAWNEQKELLEQQ